MESRGDRFVPELERERKNLSVDTPRWKESRVSREIRSISDSIGLIEPIRQAIDGIESVETRGTNGLDLALNL